VEERSKESAVLRRRKALVILILVIASLTFQAQWGAAATSTLTSAEASRHTGEAATVCGTVASATYAARSRGGPTFLNLDKPYPDHIFTIVIWREHRAAFGNPETRYAGKRLCVSGVITDYRGRPQIVVRDPSQINLSQ
jgi:DNA/RNA endonuclease YhcR with UshA esterase domain